MARAPASPWESRRNSLARVLLNLRPVRHPERLAVQAIGILALVVASGGCRAADRTAQADPCGRAKTTAARAWEDVLPAMRSAADRAREAASNCDGPTRDQPPCAGRMSDRFLDRSLTTARLAEVERAHDATVEGDPLLVRETAREVKDDPKVQVAKRAAESAYTVCVGGGAPQ